MGSRFGRKQIEKLGLPDEVTDDLMLVYSEVSEAYREDFVELRQIISEQASTLNRIQNTLSLLVERLAPEVKDSVPAVVRASAPGEEPDLASALVVSDPIGMGFTLTQADLARALGLKQGDVSVLVKAFGLADNEDCAVVVRRGKKKSGRWVNYNARAIDVMREKIAGAKMSDLADKNQQSALRRVRRSLSKRK